MPIDGPADGDTLLPEQALGLAATGAATGASLPASRDLATGAVSRFALGAVLGRGGMGEVLSARDERIGRAVAIKRIRASAPTPDAVARFLREARIQGQLEHPAIVPVHEIGTDDAGQPLFVMKQLAGVTLAETLQGLAAGEPAATARLTRQRLLRAFADVCLAIEFAHTRDIIHRDLKPANIMLGDFGEVYVLDWGVARIVGDRDDRDDRGGESASDPKATAAGAILGTPGYMAPEQARGDLDVDGRVDVYALGCILFEILTGRRLAAAGSAAVTDADVPIELARACERATRPARDDRFARARELGEAVVRFLDGDRDLAHRKHLAASLLVEAHAAVAHGDDPAARRDAIRSAARALALDPDSAEASTLVGRLMLEPPKSLPPELEAELAATEGETARPQSRMTTITILGYFLLSPIMIWAGFRQLWTYPVVLSLAVCAGALRARALREGAQVAGRVFAAHAYLAAVVVAIAVASVSSSALVALPFALIGCARIALHSRFGRMSTVWFAISLAVLVPWVGGLVGVLPPMLKISGGSLVLPINATALDPVALGVWLVWVVFALVGAMTITVRSATDRERAATREVRLQAWQLRQLVSFPRDARLAPGAVNEPR